MNREFRGAQWEFNATNGVLRNAVLRYKQYFVIVSMFDTNTLLYSIWDKSNANSIQPDGELLTHGTAAYLAAAQFQCETYLGAISGK